MGSDETAITIPGGPRVIDVFDGDGAPSGPNYLLFSDPDRLADSLWVRSEVGWSPAPHAPVLGAPQRALDPKLRGLGPGGRALPCTLPICIRRWERPRTRRRRLPTSSTDLGDPRETSGPRIDRFPPARPSWWPVPRIEKNFFWAPVRVPLISLDQ